MQHVMPGFEKRKVAIDLLKHLATLSVASIALMTSFFQQITKIEDSGPYLITAVSSFSICVLLTVFSSLILLGNIENAVKIMYTFTHYLLRWFLSGVILSFLIGVGSLSLLLLKNLA